MSLSSVSNPAHGTIRGVRFAMRGGAGLVAVSVTHAALEEIEAPRPAETRLSGALRKAQRQVRTDRAQQASAWAGGDNGIAPVPGRYDAFALEWGARRALLSSLY